MQQKVKMCRTAVLLCVGYLLLVVSSTEGVSMRGEKVEEDGELSRVSLSRNRGSREAGSALGCYGLYTYCYSDWDCCSTWCNGWCTCLAYYDWCYYDYECCTGWCDRYYGCIYPYAQRKGRDNEHQGRQDPSVKVE